MQEVLPGVFHWTHEHPKIGIEVSSYAMADGLVRMTVDDEILCVIFGQP